MKKKITIKDIAEQLKVSKTTVSRALADRWDVSPQTRKAVLDLAEKYHYKPNPMSTNLRRNESRSIGVILPELSDAFFSDVIYGIQSVLEPKNYHALIMVSHESSEQELKNIQFLENNRVDGILISLAEESENSSYLVKLQTDTPIVFFNRVYEDANISKVILNDYKWAMAACQHLADQNCRHIAHITGSEHISVCKDRTNGYVDALTANGLSTGDSYIIHSGLSMESGYKGVLELINDKIPFDGLFTVNEPTAIGAMKALKEHNIIVPQDVAVVGFSESVLSRIVEPSLTCVKQPTFEMGAISTRMLLNIIQSDILSPQTVILDAELNIRSSSLRK